MVFGSLCTCTLDERPEVHQGTVFFDFAGDDDRTVARQACEVEVPACNTLAPTTDGLT